MTKLANFVRIEISYLKYKSAQFCHKILHVLGQNNPTRLKNQCHYTADGHILFSYIADK